MTANQQAPMLTLTPETWGDQMHRAYRQARARFGGGRDKETGKAAFSYDVVARKLRSVGISMTDQVLLALERLDDPPKRMRQRQVAYFALIAYGYDPADFGLTPANVELSGYDIPRIKKAIAPAFRWTPRRTRSTTAA
jgi:hypothetical protein